MKNITVALGLLLLIAGGLWIGLGDAPESGGGAMMEGLTREVQPEPEAKAKPVATLPQIAKQPEPDRSQPGVPAAEPESGQRPLPIVAEGVFGQVTRSDGSPVAFRAVKLGIIGSGGRRPFTSTTTNIDGAYAVSLDWDTVTSQLGGIALAQVEELSVLAAELRGSGDPAATEMLASLYALLDEPLWIEVEVEDSEGFRVAKKFELKAGMARSVRMNLTLRRLRDLQGEVLVGNGFVARANVMLFDGDWNLVGTTRADDRGRFRMDGPPAGSYRLHARQIGIGAGQIGGIFIGGAVRAPKQSILLSGAMTLAGVVVTPDGDPVPGLKVTAIADSLAQTAGNPLWPTPRELAQAESLGALCFSVSATSKTGEFSMGAMEGGNYTLQFDNVPDQYQPRGFLVTGAENRVVFSACMVLVEVKGTAEQRLGTTVHLLEKPVDPLKRRSTLRHFVQPSSLGAAQFVVEPGGKWEVYVERNGERQGYKVAATPEGTYTQLVSIQLGDWRSKLSRPSRSTAPILGSATLELELKDEEGDARVGLLDLWREEESGKRLVLSRRPITTKGFGGLKPGQYSLRVHSMVGETPFLSAATKGIFSLAPGKAKRIELKVRPGGWLQLEIEGDEDLSDAVFSARLIPEVAAGAPSSLSFAIDEYGSLLNSTMGIGKLARCMPVLPGGTYTLRIDCSTKGVTVAPQMVEIEPGKVLVVTAKAK